MLSSLNREGICKKTHKIHPDQPKDLAADCRNSIY